MPFGKTPVSLLPVRIDVSKSELSRRRYFKPYKKPLKFHGAHDNRWVSPRGIAPDGK